MIKSIISLFFLLATLPSIGYALCGSVTDQEGQPVSGALVRIYNTKISTVSDSKGYFCIENSNFPEKPLTAWAPGFYIGAVDLGNQQLKIVLRRLPKDDDASYQWKASVNSSQQSKVTKTEPCQQCHTLLTREWVGDVHGSSNNNALFKKIFHGQEGLPGFKNDFSGGKNSCKACHQSAMHYVAR
jgi:hypothetical protein